MAAPVGASEGLAALTLGGMGRAPALGATGPLGQGQPNTAKPLAAPMVGTQSVIIGSGAGASAVSGG